MMERFGVPVERVFAIAGAYTSGVSIKERSDGARVPQRNLCLALPNPTLRAMGPPFQSIGDGKSWVPVKVPL